MSFGSKQNSSVFWMEEGGKEGARRYIDSISWRNAVVVALVSGDFLNHFWDLNWCWSCIMVCQNTAKKCCPVRSASIRKLLVLILASLVEAIWSRSGPCDLNGHSSSATTIFSGLFIQFLNASSSSVTFDGGTLTPGLVQVKMVYQGDQNLRTRLLVIENVNLECAFTKSVPLQVGDTRLFFATQKHPGLFSTIYPSRSITLRNLRKAQRLKSVSGLSSEPRQIGKIILLKLIITKKKNRIAPTDVKKQSKWIVPELIYLRKLSGFWVDVRKS